MALHRNTLNLVRDLGKNIRESFNALPSASVDVTMEKEKSALANYKREALNLAKQTAAERNDGKLPTMTDYFIAAQKIGETHADAMKTQGIQWTPAVFSDFSGHKKDGLDITIDGFQINREHLEPPREALLLATHRAQQAAQAAGTGKAATLTDTLLELQKIQQSDAPLPPLASLESLKDSMDLDGDHAVSQFFADVDRHAKFEGTIFSNVNFHPAGTLMRDGENGVALTEGASFNNVTFEGMGTNDTLSLAKGEYNNIHFTAIEGGHIDIADGTQVRGMDLRGAHASLHIGRASVSNLDATGAHIISLTTAKGAEISQANFEGATIDMASELQGSTWKNVSFIDANLAHVDMRGATLNGVSFTKSNLSGLDLSGAKIANMQIDGKTITNPTELAEFGIMADERTVASARETPQLTPQTTEIDQLSPTPHLNDVAKIGGTLQNAIASIGSRIAVPDPAAAASPQTAVREIAENTPSSITGGENITLTAALAGGYNQAKDMLGKVQPEQGIQRQQLS